MPRDSLALSCSPWGVSFPLKISGAIGADDPQMAVPSSCLVVSVGRISLSTADTWASLLPFLQLVQPSSSKIVTANPDLPSFP